MRCAYAHLDLVSHPCSCYCRILGIGIAVRLSEKRFHDTSVTTSAATTRYVLSSGVERHSFILLRSLKPASTTPIPSPTDFSAIPTLVGGRPSIPTGSFNLYLGSPTIVQNTCLAPPNYVEAWSCSLQPAIFQIEVRNTSSSSGLQVVEMKLGSPTTSNGLRIRHTSSFHLEH